MDHKYRRFVRFFHKGQDLLPESPGTPALELRHSLPLWKSVCSAGIDEPLVICIPGKLPVIFILEPSEFAFCKARDQTDGNAGKIFFREGQGRRLPAAPHGAHIQRRHRAKEPIKGLSPFLSGLQKGLPGCLRKPLIGPPHIPLFQIARRLPVAEKKYPHKTLLPYL